MHCKTDLQTTTQTIQNATLRALFESHCFDLAGSITNAENWLQTGFNFVLSKTNEGINQLPCPFCKQEISQGMELLQAYSLRFNIEFNTFMRRLEDSLSRLRNINLGLINIGLTNVNDTNTTRIATWSAHLPATISAPVFNIINDIGVFGEQLNEIIAAVELKLRSPSVSIDVSSIISFRATGRALHGNIVGYNQVVDSYNAAIIAFKSSIQTSLQAQTELHRLNRIQKRFETNINELCLAIIQKNSSLRELETAYTSLSAQQEQETTTFFTNYKDRINHYLGNVFRTQFQITDVRHVAPAGKAIHGKIGYKLTIDGHDISFDHSQPRSIKECLSEGDKSTIALAFFLSKLDLDTSLSNKVMVFDDPLSSLDTNRRNYTISIIKNLFTKMKQVIVLSHNEFFLHELIKDVATTELKMLRIDEIPATKESKIGICDLNELVKNEYFKQIEGLEAFRQSPNIVERDKILGWLRTVLETHLKFKFHHHVRSMTRQKTFGNLIRHIESNNVTFTDNTNRIDIIAKLDEINNISWRPHHGSDMPQPDFTALGYNPATITLTELDNLIQDTLELMNNKL